MNVIEVFGCASCGDVTLRARLAGVLAVNESGTVSTSAEVVAVYIATELAVGAESVKFRVGECWACVTEQDVSRETLRQDAEADDGEHIPE